MATAIVAILVTADGEADSHAAGWATAPASDNLRGAGQRAAEPEPVRPARGRRSTRPASASAPPTRAGEHANQPQPYLSSPCRTTPSTAPPQGYPGR